MAEGKIRIKDIAKIAGVSATTVSNVIHGRTEKVSRKTRKRIEEILDEQKYAPSMGARILSGKSSGMIAVVVGKKQEWEQESEKLEEILREIEKSLDEREYYMLLHFVKQQKNLYDMRRYGNWMGLSVSGSMKRSVQESGRCVQFRWLRYTEQTGFTEKPVRKSQGFCLKERNRESGFWMERKSTEKWYGRECRKYFQKKAVVLKKNNIWKFQKTGICGECSIKSGWQGLLYPQICSYLHLPYREQRLSVICMIWKSRCRRKLK